MIALGLALASCDEQAVELQDAGANPAHDAAVIDATAGDATAVDAAPDAAASDATASDAARDAAASDTTAADVSAPADAAPDRADLPEAPPLTTDQQVQIQEDERAEIALTYSDINGDLASACEVTEVSEHLVVFQACACDPAGRCTIQVYGTPQHYHGAASFTFAVQANGAWSNSSLMQVEITPVNDLPVVEDLLLIYRGADTTEAQLVASDVESSQLSFEATSEVPSGFSLDAAGLVRFTHTLETLDLTQVLFTALDEDQGESTMGSITIIPQDHASSTLLHDSGAYVLRRGSDGSWYTLGSYGPTLRKLDSAGAQLWELPFAVGLPWTNGQIFYGDMILDAQDNAYVALSADQEIEGQLPAGGSDALIAKVDPDGALVWLRLVDPGGSSSYARGYSVEVEPDGARVYLGGGAEPMYRHDQHTAPFLSALDSDGELLWSASFPLPGTSSQAFLAALARGGDGQLHSLLMGQLRSDGRDDFVLDLQRHGASGTVTWSMTVDSTSSYSGRMAVAGLHVDAASADVAVAYRSTFTPPGGSYLYQEGGVVLARYSSAGELRWSLDLDPLMRRAHTLRRLGERYYVSGTQSLWRRRSDGMLESSSGMALLAVDAASGAPLLRATPLVNGALWGTLYDVASDGASGVVLVTGASLVALQP